MYIVYSWYMRVRSIILQCYSYYTVLLSLARNCIPSNIQSNCSTRHSQSFIINKQNALPPISVWRKRKFNVFQSESLPPFSPRITITTAKYPCCTHHKCCYVGKVSLKYAAHRNCRNYWVIVRNTAIYVVGRSLRKDSVRTILPALLYVLPGVRSTYAHTS